MKGVSVIWYIGEYVSHYEENDLIFINPYIPYLNFNFGTQDHCQQVIIQMKKNFLEEDFLNASEFTAIKILFEKGCLWHILYWYSEKDCRR
ncbi:MAG: hypothetical protein ACMUEM_01870 [Flavobacteriales bacterium AspAUS03]